MRALQRMLRRSPWLASVVAATLLAAGCAPMASPAPSGANVVLGGNQEWPPVTSPAGSSDTITVLMDRSVSGTVTTSGVPGTAPHIHLAAPGQNWPVIVPLNPTGENQWSVPPGIRFNDAQYEAYRLGNLYVKVNSAAHPGGEIRGQIRP